MQCHPYQEYKKTISNVNMGTNVVCYKPDMFFTFQDVV